MCGVWGCNKQVTSLEKQTDLLPEPDHVKLIPRFRPFPHTPDKLYHFRSIAQLVAHCLSYNVCLGKIHSSHCEGDTASSLSDITGVSGCPVSAPLGDLLPRLSMSNVPRQGDPRSYDLHERPKSKVLDACVDTRTHLGPNGQREGRA